MIWDQNFDLWNQKHIETELHTHFKNCMMILDIELNIKLKLLVNDMSDIKGLLPFL